MRLLIATHGLLAKGFKSCLEIIVGNVEKVDVLSCYVDELDIDSYLEQYFKMHHDEKIIICSDVFGGSVNQKIISKTNGLGNCFLLTGINLPLLLNILIDINLGNDVISKLDVFIEQSKNQIINVDEYINVMSNQDDFD